MGRCTIYKLQVGNYLCGGSQEIRPRLTNEWENGMIQMEVMVRSQEGCSGVNHWEDTCPGSPREDCVCSPHTQWVLVVASSSQHAHSFYWKPTVPLHLPTTNAS